MILQTFGIRNDAALAVTQLIVKRIRDFAPTADRKFVLALPTGSTPIPVYKALVTMCQNKEISFEHVITINLDEYLGLSYDHPQSYACFMHEQFFSKVNIPPTQCHLLCGTAPDPDYECARYEALITTLGGIHLLFAGIGGNGHIAFNEPSASMASRTRLIALNEETRTANSRFFGPDEQVPTHALSMGMGTILDADEIVILATGRNKAEGVRDSIEGPLSHLCPGSALQAHSKGRFITDDGAASLLSEKTRQALHSRLEPEAPGLGTPINKSRFENVCNRLPSPSPITSSSREKMKVPPKLRLRLYDYPGIGCLTTNGTMRTDSGFIISTPTSASTAGIEQVLTPQDSHIIDMQTQQGSEVLKKESDAEKPHEQDEISPAQNQGIASSRKPWSGLLDGWRWM